MKPIQRGCRKSERLRIEKLPFVSLVSFVVKGPQSAIGNRQSAMVSFAQLMRFFRPMLCALIALMLAASAFAADAGTEAAQRLAAQIVAKVGAGSAVALAINNRSGMSEGRVADLKQKIASALRAQGLEAVEASRAVAQLEITVSENAQGYLLVAVINEGQSHNVTMVSMARAASATMPGGSLLVLRKTPVWAQHAPILDAALLANGTELLVLDPARIALYSLQNGAGTLLEQQAVSFTIRSRDLRGRSSLRRKRSAGCSNARQAATATAITTAI